MGWRQVMSQFHLKERRLGGHQGPQHSLIASFPSRELHDFCLMSRWLLPDILKGRHKSFFFFFLLILNEHLEWYLKVHISIRNFITFFPSLLDRSLSLHDWLRLSESPVRLGPASILAGLGQRPSLGFYAVFGMLNHLLSGVMWTTEWAGQRFWRLMEKHGLWRSM